MSRFRWTALTMVAALAAGQTQSAGAQLRRRPVATTQPNWFGGGVSVFQSYSVVDGLTNATWRFDSGLGYTASFEHPTQNGIMLGFEGTYATPMLVYTGGTASDAVNCAGGCNAKGTVTQIMGLVHSVNGYAFHPVYQLTVGATGFSNFREQTTSAKIGPNATDYDFSFAIAYGIGFGLSSSSAVEVVQEIGTVLHQRTDLPAGSGNYPRIGVTRLTAKFAF